MRGLKVANVHNVLPTLTPAMVKALRDPQCYGSSGTRHAVHAGLISTAVQSSPACVIWMPPHVGIVRQAGPHVGLPPIQPPGDTP